MHGNRHYIMYTVTRRDVKPKKRLIQSLTVVRNIPKYNTKKVRGGEGLRPSPLNDLLK